MRPKQTTLHTAGDWAGPIGEEAVRLAPKDPDYRNNLAKANEEAKGKW